MHLCLVQISSQSAAQDYVKIFLVLRGRQQRYNIHANWIASNCAPSQLPAIPIRFESDNTSQHSICHTSIIFVYITFFTAKVFSDLGF